MCTYRVIYYIPQFYISGQAGRAEVRLATQGREGQGRAKHQEGSPTRIRNRAPSTRSLPGARPGGLASFIHSWLNTTCYTLSARRSSARRAAGNIQVYASFRPHGEVVPTLYYKPPNTFMSHPLPLLTLEEYKPNCP